MRSDILRVLAPAAVIVVHAAAATPAGAQVHFPPPPDRPVFTRYTIPEQCLAAVNHSVDSVRWRERRDTLTYDPMEANPPQAVETARQCVARFTPAKVDTVSLRALRDLALAANDDSLAARAVAREYADNATQPLDARAAVLVDAVRANLDAHPARVEAAEQIAHRIDALGLRASTAQLRAHGLLVSYLSKDPQNLEHILAEAKAIQAVIDRVPPDIRAADSTTWSTMEQYMRFAQVSIAELRDGPAAGLAEMRARGWTAGTVLGQRAPTIAGAYWFNRADAAPRPRAGKVSLVVFVDPVCGERCLPYQATLRRLARAHPEVEITLVSQTQGYFDGLLTTRPADEAEQHRRYLFDVHRLPGALAVDSTPFLRMPAADNRRVNTPSRNALAYQILAGSVAINQTPGTFYECYVIGPDGIIDFNGTVMPENEKIILLQIDAIERSTGVSQASP